LHISKIEFLFLVSFTIEYKVGIAEFYLYMGFGADLLKKKCGHQSLKTAKIGIRTPLKSANYFRFVLQRRRRSNHISEPHAKFRENRSGMVDVMVR